MAVYEGFQAIAQNYISKGIASNYFIKSPLLAVMAGLTLENSKPTGLEIGRPGVGDVFSGTKLTKVERMALGGINAYLPAFGINNPSNGKIEGARDTAPTVANPTTASHSQLRGTAQFNWTGVIKEPILIWKSDLDRSVRAAGRDADGRGLARAKIIKEATDHATQQVYTTIATEILSGSPTDQDSDPWDHLCGITTAFDTANVYGRVDRSAAKNAQWRSNKDTTSRAFDVADLIDIANLDYGMATKGEGATLMLTGLANYKLAKAQVLGKGGVEMLNAMPQLGEFGFNREILKRDNCYIMYDPGLPASVAYLFDLRVWKWITHPDHSFKVTPFRDLSEYQEGGKEALQAFVELQCMLTCDNPGLNVAFTNLTT